MKDQRTGMKDSKVTVVINKPGAPISSVADYVLKAHPQLRSQI